MKLIGQLDAAVWFDMLSILEIKMAVLTDPLKIIANRRALYRMELDLSKQLKEKFEKIVSSQEYGNLYQANKRVFDAVNKAEDITNISGISAYEVAQLNLLRYECKLALQEKFFTQPMEEVKTGEYNGV